MNASRCVQASTQAHPGALLDHESVSPNSSCLGVEDEERRIGYKVMEKETQLDRMAKNKEWRERKRSTGSSNSLRDQFLDDCINNR